MLWRVLLMDDRMLMIFDFFGVICSELSPVWLKKYLNDEQIKAVRADLNARADRGEISDEEFYDGLSALTGVAPAKIRADWLEMAVINRDLLDYIETLRRDCSVVLLSNAPHGLIREIIARDNIDRYFDRMIISAEVHLAKPDPAIYELMLSQCSVPASRAVMIDDNPVNLDGAARAGIRGILYHDLPSLRTSAARSIAKTPSESN